MGIATEVFVMATPGTLRDTYVAAIQHDLVDVSDAGCVLGVVRRSPTWFTATVDENDPALGPPESLLDEFDQCRETFKMQGLCDEGAHNAAWDEVDFARRYRSHLRSGRAADSLDDLEHRLERGDDVVLVCFENTEKKRCHRTILREVLTERTEGDPSRADL